jgi:hypothetical protein
MSKEFRWSAPVRWARGLWPDRNPLRRRVDRLSAAVALCLLVAFLVGAPLLGLLAGRAAYQAGLAAQRTEKAHWHPVPAVLLARSPDQHTIRGTGIGTPVRAKWTAPDGRVCTGLVHASPGARAGSTVRIWVTSAGRLTARPLQPFQVSDQAELAGLGAGAGLGVVLLIVGIGTSRWLNRRRLAAWGADWRATAPRWTSRH